MMLLEQLHQQNPELQLYSVADQAFAAYGRVLELPAEELLEAAAALPIPAEGAAYTAAEPALEACASAAVLQERVFGGLPMQLGYCRGHNDRLNALEWHACSEINVAVSPLVLLLGQRQELCGDRYDVGRLRAFLVEPGQAVEIYATTLHFTPCQVSADGFGCLVGLSAGTNLPLARKTGDPLLYAQNKWLLAHAESKALIQKGAPIGVYGNNIRVKGV